VSPLDPARKALQRVKAFAEAWPDALEAMALSTREQLQLTDLNRVIALAEQAVHDADNPPRGGH
jgi:hypothetical protein